ncbi:MAG: NADPH-dependent assimilatory sulfite reductase hemoprotein subunit [Ilumatobacteraceae bacterium]|jgi:sulfite reductase (ferredoxin)|nr:NADPH-dependent assimilatory sulfite reductase hemoprotein subunit [Ilumatobacteraceae bacterium]
MGVEDIKVASRYLAGTIGDELDRGEGAFGHDDVVVLKFHGIYQQDDRDVRRARTQAKLPLDYSCMVRSSVPGGVISPDQWRSLDALADLGDGSLRLTTRQGVQYHVVHQGDLRELVAGINRATLTTLAACGDVVRNVMACPLPDPERQAVLEPLVAGLVRRFRPRTDSYWELWVDGERAVTAEPPPVDGPVEPVYGETYLPRKFKIAVAWPGDNCVDLHAHDVAIVPTLTDVTRGGLTGFVVLAGGGMGMSHARPDDTFPRLADPIGWVEPEGLLDVVEAIVTAHRDHGDRTDRSRARLKYLVHDHGVDWLRAQIEARTGRPLAPPPPLPPMEVHDHHGAEPAGLVGVYGLPVPSGRVAGSLRVAVREVIDRGIATELRVTARQDLLFVGVEDLAELEATLARHGVALPHEVSPARRLAIACPALPTCGQALGEAERALPAVVDRLEKVLADTGNEGLDVRLNMTGCPNGCSRPYTAEIGIVGRSKTSYDLYLGGTAAGDRLARLVRADVPLDGVVALLEPVLRQYAEHADEGVGFGDWCAEHGPEEIGTWLPAPTVRRRRRAGAEAAP